MKNDIRIAESLINQGFFRNVRYITAYALLFNMNNTYRFITQYHLLICTYHPHSCSTQQPFYEVEIICFSVIFVTQQTVYDVGVISGSDSVLNSSFRRQ